MKKLIYLLLALMFISAIPEVANAQSNDPFEQKTLKASGKNGRHEKKINRKKVDVTTTEDAQSPKDVEATDKPAVKTSMMTLSNPCEDWLDVEFVSLIGSRASQTIKLTLKITNHSTNKDMNIGGNFVAYDNDGEEHTRGWAPERYSTLTDVPFKTSFEVPGKINPNKTKVLPAMIFSIGECRIEMRNVPIDWK